MALAAVLAVPFCAGSARAATVAQFQEVVDAYLSERSEAEHNSGVAAYISLGDPGPAIELFSGFTSIGGDVPVSGETLFQIGSITKGFTGALMLALEAEGKLDIDQTVGDWLPLYPAWKDVTIRRLLHMVSGIPTYSESPTLIRLWSTDPYRHFTLEDLIDFAYPSDTVDLPPSEGWF
jgi:D-alanyl-D-alanine carboxypeptidase